MIKGKRMLSCLLAGVLAVSLAIPVNATDINEAERRQKQLEEQKKAAEAQASSLTTRLESIVSDIETTEQNMAKTSQEIAQAEEDLIAAKTEETKQYNGMKRRIKYMYENGGTEFIEVLLAAKDISDFLNKAEYITKLSEYDRDMLVEFQRLIKVVEEKEKALEEDYKSLETMQSELNQKQAEVEKLMEENSSELASIESEMSEVKELVRKAKEAAKPKPIPNPSKPGNGNPGKPGGGSSSKPGGSVVSGNGYFTHPCPGMSYQSSYFGEVRQGIGDPNPHKGNDYAAPRGTAVYAAAAGTVTTAGYSQSAGNWVVINHGNGLVSKYMHMFELPYVSAGQKVSKGQHIGGVGTTGMSTGNHLHFQVELNGVPVNPDNYF